MGQILVRDNLQMLRSRAPDAPPPRKQDSCDLWSREFTHSQNLPIVVIENAQNLSLCKPVALIIPLLWRHWRSPCFAQSTVTLGDVNYLCLDILVTQSDGELACGDRVTQWCVTEEPDKAAHRARPIRPQALRPVRQASQQVVSIWTTG